MSRHYLDGSPVRFDATVIDDDGNALPNRRATRTGRMSRMPRPLVADGSSRLIYISDGEAEFFLESRGIGKDRHFQTQVIVKTGSERMRKQFEARALSAGLQFNRIGADDGPCEHYADCSGQVIPTERGAMLVPNLNASVRNEYLVWGHNAALLSFLMSNTGEGKPIAKWGFPQPVRVANASGAGAEKRRKPLHNERDIQTAIRDMDADTMAALKALRQ